MNVIRIAICMPFLSTCCCILTTLTNLYARLPIPFPPNQNMQRINSVISDMIDKHESIYGPVPDRSVFDGDIVVPPHLRNMSATLGNRSSRLLGSLNRSRTFLTLPTNGRHSYIHGSVPDLSRSLPNTPNVAKQRMTLGDSVGSVLEEDDKSSVPSRITNDGVEVRRKSEQDVHRVQLLPVSGSKPSVFTTTPSHYRNNSDSSSTLPHAKQNSTMVLPFRLQQPKKTSVNSSIPLKSFFRKESPLLSSSLHNIHTVQSSEINDEPPSPATPSKWGNVRNSNSFSNDFNVASLSTRYTIPRPHLVPVALTEDGQTIVSDQQIILNRMGTDDSAA